MQALFDRIRSECGRLDLLVNNVWGGYEDPDCRPLTMAPFWEQSPHQWDAMFAAGVRAHLIASRLAVPLMLGQRRGLILSTTANLAALLELSRAGKLRPYLTELDGLERVADAIEMIQARRATGKIVIRVAPGAR